MMSGVGLMTVFVVVIFINDIGKRQLLNLGVISEELFESLQRLFRRLVVASDRIEAVQRNEDRLVVGGTRLLKHATHRELFIVDVIAVAVMDELESRSNVP